MKNNMNYKKYTVALALIGFAFIASPVKAATPVVAGNLITNAAMLDATVSSTTPDHWSPGGYNASSTYSYPVAGPSADDSAVEVSVSTISAGAAEWFFDAVPVASNTTYAYADWYKSTTDSYVIAQWTLNDNSFKYQTITTVPSTNGSWVKMPQQVFTAPGNVRSLTILHLLQTPGTLALSNSSLVVYSPTAAESFDAGMVSLTFDDGWTSQYDTAWPILKAANFSATFYIITNPMKSASYDIFKDPRESIVAQSTPNGTTWFEIYRDPSSNIYRFSDSYQSAGTSTITVNYTLENSATSSQSIELPASTTFRPSSFVFTLPALTPATPLVITHTSDQDIVVQNPSLTEYNSGYMSSGQIIDLQTAGNEIGAHATNHCNLLELDRDPNSSMTLIGGCVPPMSAPTTAQAEVSTARADLSAVNIMPNVSMAYPYGAYNSNVKTVLTNNGFTSARTVDVGYNTKQLDRLALKGQTVDSKTTIDDVRSWIDYSINNKVWLVLIFHQIDNPATISSNGEDGGSTPELLTEITNYLASTHVQVKTVNAALASFTTVPDTTSTTTATTTTPTATSTATTTTPTPTPNLEPTIAPQSGGGYGGSSQPFFGRGGSVLRAYTYFYSRYLINGSRGNDVTELQMRLKDEGVYDGPVTGYYGVLTAAGVKRYQEKNNIEKVGVVGPKTRKALNGK